MQVHATHRRLVQKLDPGDGDAQLDRLDRGLNRALQIIEGADGGGDFLGDAVKPQGDSGDNAQSALRSHEEMRQVIARAGFARPGAGVDQAAVGQHDLERQHILRHGTITHRIGTRSPRRGHAAQAGIGARIDREKEAGVAQMRIQRLARDAGLDRHIHIGAVQRKDPLHPRQIDGHPALGRGNMTLER